MQSLMGSPDFDPEAAGEADGDEYSRERSESSSVGSRYAAAAQPHRGRAAAAPLPHVWCHPSSRSERGSFASQPSTHRRTPHPPNLDRCKPTIIGGTATNLSRTATDR